MTLYIARQKITQRQWTTEEREGCIKRENEKVK